MYAYLREKGREKFLITLNFSPKTACITPGMDLRKARMILSNYEERKEKNVCRRIKLRPYEANIWKWEEAD